MKVRKAFIYLAVFIILWFGVSLILHEIKSRSLMAELGTTKGNIRRKDKIISDLIHSVELLRRERTLKDSLWVELLDEKKALLEREVVKYKLLKERHEKLKNSPPPRWTNAELDSLLESIIR